MPTTNDDHSDTQEMQPSKEVLNRILENQEQKNVTREGKIDLETEEERIYAEGLRILNKTGISYAVGAALARHFYTGVWRTTKDLDLFVSPGDLKTVLDAFAGNGFEIEVSEKHWLAKAHKKGFFIDIIFASGHGHLRVDETWFHGSQPARVLRIKTQILPIEVMIALAVFVATRNRFDGAEVAHLILSRKGNIDWQRIIDLLGEHWELLLWHLVFFDYIYPGHPEYLPQDVMIRLFQRVRRRWAKGSKNPEEFRGTIIDPFIFAVDVEDWGYKDQRKLEPLVDDEGDLL